MWKDYGAMKRFTAINNGVNTSKRLRVILPKTNDGETEQESCVPEAGCKPSLDDYHIVPEDIVEQVKQSRYRQGYILPMLQMTRENWARNVAEALRVMIDPYNEFTKITTDISYMDAYFEKFWPLKSNVPLENDSTRIAAGDGFQISTNSVKEKKNTSPQLEKKHRRKQTNPRPKSISDTFDNDQPKQKVIDLTREEDVGVKEPVVLEKLGDEKDKKIREIRIISVYSHVCLFCSKFFCDTSKLVHHMCYCSLCKLPFHRGIIDQHYQRIHRDKVRKCELCFKHFILEAHLAQHHKREHAKKMIRHCGK